MNAQQAREQSIKSREKANEYFYNRCLTSVANTVNSGSGVNWCEIDIPDNIDLHLIEERLKKDEYIVSTYIQVKYFGWGDFWGRNAFKKHHRLVIKW